MIALSRRVCLAVLLCAAPALAQDGVTAWVNQLLREKDDAELELVQKIAGSRTREGALGLVEAFDKVGSLLMRREIVRGLGQFANVPDAEQPALEKLANIAGQEPQAELRGEALTGLARSAGFGKSLRRRRVGPAAPGAVREPALAEHVKFAPADDAEWYRHVWNLEQKQRKDQNGDIAAPELPAIRLLAFRGLLPFLGEDELVEAIRRETNPKIRRAALLWMDQKQMPKTAEMAEWVLERVDLPGADRAEAATIYLDKVGDKAVAKFLGLMKKRDVTPEDLRVRMAELLVGMRDGDVDKRLAKLLGRGKPHEKVFVLHATANCDDPKVLAAIRKQLGDRDVEVRRAAAEALGRRRDRDALPALHEMLQAPDDPADLRIALEAITAIEGLSSAWLKQLAGFASHENRELRNAAIEVIGRARDKRHLEVVLAALSHPDWSTRFAAIDAVESIRHKDGVAALVERIGAEQGRMRRRIAEVLWRLTAQLFDEDAAAWRGWWAEAGAKFEVASEKELDAAERERERRRLTARTTAAPKFFGIDVESHRVIFVIDISGSMIESMYGRYVGKRPAARIDIAKQELKQAIENLDEGALFNVFAFSGGVARWQEEGIGVNTAQSRADALEWIERLGASGATNLYDALKLAFADPDVDTIFVMSDGEPTSGEVIDPHRIRQDVAEWNRHRKVKIHTVAIGGNLEVLEWLANDAGGTYLQMR